MDVYHPNWLKHRQTDFQRLFEVLTPACLVVNADLKVVAVSDAYLRITENQRVNLVGKYLDRDFVRNPEQPWIANVRRLIKSFRYVQRTANTHRFKMREKSWDHGVLDGSPRRLWRAISSPIVDQRGKLTLIRHQLKKFHDPTSSQLVRNFGKRLIAAQEKDRKRIARELHDQMAQYLSAISLELESLKTNDDRNSRDQTIEHIQGLIEHVGDDVHRLTWDLRPAPIEELGFRNSLFNCVEEMSAHSVVQIYFHSNLTVTDRFDPAIETICYRLVQEALANIAKHANAKTASVVIMRQGSELEMIVADDGVGFDMDEFQRSEGRTTHFGLQGMSERLKLVGGKLQIESVPENGTSLIARVPTGEMESR